MEGMTMLRQLITELEEVLELYSSPPPAVTPNYSVQARPRPRPTSGTSPLRWYIFDLEASSLEDSCYNLKMTPDKSENLKKSEPSKPNTKKARKERSRGKATVSADSTENMDRNIWKEFPEDLYEAVVARLPITTFFRFRSVCQKWNLLLTSQSFAQECAEMKQPQSWFYTITHENVNVGSMYDPSLKRWYHPNPPVLPTVLKFLPVASAGGLICFLDIGHQNFYVCNPLTRSSRELPPRPVKVWSRVAVGMTVNGKSAISGYKILCISCEGEYHVYDSRTNSWSCPGNMPSTIEVPLALNFRSHSICVNQTLYFMRSDRDEDVLSYDMETGIWKQFPIPAPPHLSDHTLAECGGKIMLVGLLTKNAATCVCIWELQKMTLLWKEVDRMPNIWCLEFYGKHVRMSCLGNKGLLMLSLRSGQMNRLVTYDLMSREWVKVPGCVLPRGKRRQCIACGIAFQPCSTAVP